MRCCTNASIACTRRWQSQVAYLTVTRSLSFFINIKSQFCSGALQGIFELVYILKSLTYFYCQSIIRLGTPNNTEYPSRRMLGEKSLTLAFMLSKKNSCVVTHNTKRRTIYKQCPIHKKLKKIQRKN